MRYLGCLVVLLFFGDSLEVNVLDKEVGPVVYVNMLYRHGERTIKSPTRHDPWGDIKYWPQGYGQLIPAGMNHHYLLGKWLRKRYLNLLVNGLYNRSTIYVLSTDVDRTLQSAATNLAGMFPPIKNQVWSDYIKWQPIPIHTVPKSYDKILSMGAPCKKYDQLFAKFEKSKAYQKMSNKYKPLYRYLEMHTAEYVHDPKQINHFNTNWMIEEIFNYTIPQWAFSIYPKLTREPSALKFALPTWTKELKRLRGGPLLKQMIQNFEDKINNNFDPPGRNISMYSGHDDTVANLLNTMGLYNMVAPPFASLVLMELRKSPKNEYFVTIHYKNSTDPFAEPLHLTPPNCTPACPLAKLKELYKPVIPDDWDLECNNE